MAVGGAYEENLKHNAQHMYHIFVCTTTPDQHKGANSFHSGANNLHSVSYNLHSGSVGVVLPKKKSWILWDSQAQTLG